MKHCYDPAFKYVKASEQGPDYLAKKFERMKRERLAREKAEREASKPIQLVIRRKEGNG